MKITLLSSLFVLSFVLFESRAFGQRNSDKYGEVFIFFNLSCPICQKYIHEVNAITAEYRREFDFKILVVEEVRRKELKSFTNEYGVKFFVEKASKDDIVRLNPSVTPEVFLFDYNGSLVYQGAIDNWFYELGKYRKEPTEFYLKESLKALLSGTNPSISKTEAIGCMISKSKTH